MAMDVKVASDEIRGTLKMRIEFDIARDVANCTVAQLSKVVQSALVDELEKSPEFKEAVRKLALEKLVKLIGE